MTEKDAGNLVDEMRSIKMLLILQLIGQGFKQKQIASMLGISEATMSRMLPSGLPKNASKKKLPGTVLDANGEN